MMSAKVFYPPLVKAEVLPDGLIKLVGMGQDVIVSESVFRGMLEGVMRGMDLKDQAAAIEVWPEVWPEGLLEGLLDGWLEDWLKGEAEGGAKNGRKV